MARILTAWDVDPSIPIGCVLLLVGWFAAHRPRCRPDLARGGCFAAGVAVMFIALTSPIDTLGDAYLFSAHMLQHMLLILVVPPLLILGLSPRFVRAVIGVPALGAIEGFVRRPAIAWLPAMAALWIWHIPALFDAALANENLHIVEHLCFMSAATIFWWPILCPLETSRMPAMAALLYLFAAMLAPSLLGIAITFAGPGLYQPYLHPEDPLRIAGLLRDTWGLTPEVDQELGGLLMWVPGGLVFLAAIFVVMARWYQAPDEFSAGALN